MKQMQRPVIFTIGFGIIAGMAFIPLTIIVSRIISWPAPFTLVIWGYLALYCGFLAGWQQNQLIRMVIPLSLLLGGAVYDVPVHLFMMIGLGVLAWIRSGICADGLGIRGILTELITTVGGALLVAWFTPNYSPSWAMGTLLFFLVQALYFPLMGIRDASSETRAPGDPFETARKEAEKILSGFV